MGYVEHEVVPRLKAVIPRSKGWGVVSVKMQLLQ